MSDDPRAIGQFVRYGLVGAALNLAGYAVYLIATWLGAGPKTTMSVLYAAAATAGFFGHRRWAFGHRGSIAASSWRYALAHALGYAINFSMLAFFADRLGLAHQWVQAAAIGVVTLFLFAAFRYFVFATRR